MAKIVIADNPSGINMAKAVERELWTAAIEAKDRLGSKSTNLDLIHISPKDMESRLNVKIVLSPSGKPGSDLIETTFGFDCTEYCDCLSQALSQQILTTIKNALGSKAESLTQQAANISAILFHIAETAENSRNEYNCPECGTKTVEVPTWTGKKVRDCPRSRCHDKNPTCPDCEQKTRRRGLIYLCLNCGREFGTS